MTAFSQMTPRERLLTALANGRPDRLPCQVHSWMDYYLRAVLGGADQYQAYQRFGIDQVIYQRPDYQLDPAEQANFVPRQIELPARDGERRWREEIDTPDGVLARESAANDYTTWDVEHLIKDEADFERYARWAPLPVAVDWTPVRQAKRRLGQDGIVRSSLYGAGQGAPWQDFCYLYGTEPAIMAACDRPDWVHHVLETLLDRKLRVLEMLGRVELDLVECGGGAGSSTVISPRMHEQFCLPYDRRHIAALHAAGTKVVYHLCGGLMPLLETVLQNGADALETMTPPSMGGDCDLAEASRRVGDRIAFIGGFDQNAGFENGTPARAAVLVRQCFEATRDHAGYICCPSDHFFFGPPANLHAFADTCRQCVY